MSGFNQQRNSSGRAATKSIFWIIGGLLLISACRYVMENEQAVATLVAIRVQQTQLAGTSSVLVIPDATQSTFIIPTQEQVDPVLQLTASQVALTPAAGIPAPEDDIPNFERRRKAARVLLFENMSASGYVRYVKEALDLEGYFYLDVGSATGWFRNQLLSSTNWDLVIAAAEARREFGGEYFELINQHLELGEAAIIEHWDIDLAPNGKVAGLLKACGLQFDTDWYEPELRVFFWLVPEHPIFHTPHEIPMFTNANWLWKGDIGDMLEIHYQSGQAIGDTVLLAGTSPGISDQHGTLAVCYDNRLVLQTFSSHEYSNYDVIRLWQNYIYHTLRARFAGQEVSLIQTPLVEESLSDPLIATQTSSAVSAGGNVLKCEGILSGQLARPVRTQQQLFEHNAEGEFVIVDLQLENLSQNPVQIWDDDYRIEGFIGGTLVNYPIQKAATGYLFIQDPKNLWQDLLLTSQPWETILAFDVDPRGERWELVLTPGSEVNEQICELRIPLP